MKEFSVYKNVWRMPIHVPFGDINGGHMLVEDGCLVIDYYGDALCVERFEDFDLDTITRIIHDWQESKQESK